MAGRGNPSGIGKFNPKLYVRTGITEEEIMEIKHAFDLFDVDGNGALDLKEIQTAMASMGFDIKNQEAVQMIRDLDEDGSEKIEFDEFLDMMTATLKERETREYLKKIFDIIDYEKDGQISIKNLRKIANDLGEIYDESELREMIERADTDSDGFVTFEDFYAILTKKAV